MATRYGMVLTFDTEEQAKQARYLLAEAELIEVKEVRWRDQVWEEPKVHAYEDEHGGPVFYIP